MCLNMFYPNCLEGSHKGLSLLYVFYICPHANLYDVLTVCVLYRSAPKTPSGIRYCICLNMFYSNRLQGSHKGLSSLYVFYIDIHPNSGRIYTKGYLLYVFISVIPTQLHVFYIGRHANLQDSLTAHVLYRSSPNLFDSVTEYVLFRSSPKASRTSSLHMFYKSHYPSLQDSLNACVLYRLSSKPSGGLSTACVLYILYKVPPNPAGGLGTML